MQRLQGAVAEAAGRRAVGRGRRLQRRRAAGHDVDAIAEPERFQRVVGDEQHRAPGEQARGKRLQPGAGDGVERGEGLVHEHDGAVFHQRAGERHPLAHAAGEGVGERIRLRAEADALQQRQRARPVGPLAPEPSAEGDVAERAQPRHQQVLLRHVGHGCAARAAGYAQAAGVEPLQAGDDPQQARLADAARPQQAGPAAPLQGEVEAVEEQRAFEAEARAAHADGVVRHGIRRIRLFWRGHVSFPTPVLTGSGSRGRRVGSDLSAAHGSPRAASIMAEGRVRCKRAGARRRGTEAVGTIAPGLRRDAGCTLGDGGPAQSPTSPRPSPPPRGGEGERAGAARVSALPSEEGKGRRGCSTGRGRAVESGASDGMER